VQQFDDFYKFSSKKTNYETDLGAKVLKIKQKKIANILKKQQINFVFFLNNGILK